MAEGARVRQVRRGFNVTPPPSTASATSSWSCGATRVATPARRSAPASCRSACPWRLRRWSRSPAEPCAVCRVPARADRLPRPSAARRARVHRGGSTSPRATSSATAPPPRSTASKSWAWPSTSTVRSGAGGLGLPVSRQYAHDDLDAYCGFVREETDLRLGIEADYVRAARTAWRNLLVARLDFVVGSVHSLATARWTPRTTRLGRRRVGQRSGGASSNVAESALSGLYDVIAHPDLVKVWGERAPRPDEDLRSSTAGRRGVRRGGCRGRAVHGRAAEAGRRALPGATVPGDGARGGLPIALRATRTCRAVGYPLGGGAGAAGGAGVGELAVFERRQRRMEPIG